MRVPFWQQAKVMILWRQPRRTFDAAFLGDGRRLSLRTSSGFSRE
jgi:hypothetical protein